MEVGNHYKGIFMSNKDGTEPMVENAAACYTVVDDMRTYQVSVGAIMAVIGDRDLKEDQPSAFSFEPDPKSGKLTAVRFSDGRRFKIKKEGVFRPKSGGGGQNIHGLHFQLGPTNAATKSTSFSIDGLRVQIRLLETTVQKSDTDWSENFKITLGNDGVQTTVEQGQYEWTITHNHSTRGFCAQAQIGIHSANKGTDPSPKDMSTEFGLFACYDDGPPITNYRRVQDAMPEEKWEKITAAPINISYDLAIRGSVASGSGTVGVAGDVCEPSEAKDDKKDECHINKGEEGWEFL